MQSNKADLFCVSDKISYPKRQAHLDFHTSPLMPGVGSRFSRKDFQAALTEGHVSSITIFAKCHHGLCYYPTQIGTVHPTLDFDLLGEMMDAAHEIGVRAPVYITAGFSVADAEAHPEWIARNKDGSYRGINFDSTKTGEDAMPECCWRNMCLNDGSYCQHIYALTEEICSRYPNLDGLFYDICFFDQVCYCPECLEGMRKAGFDPENEADARKYYIEKHIAFMEKCGAILRKQHPNATIFFNSGGADVAKPQYHPYETHYEMEDLPTAWGGYNKMAPNARFFEKTGKFYLGMTGKFHLAWGEFGGFKSKEALRYETCYMALYGAGVSIGDQLYPDGEMDSQTYENIGYAYSYLEKIEPYCYDGEYVTNLGVYWTEDTEDINGIANTPYDKNGLRYPALAQKGNVMYMAHSISKIYKQYGCLAHRNYFMTALQLLGHCPTTKVALGSGTRVTTLHQPNKNRYCINLTYASPVKRGVADIIDEILPQYNVAVSQAVTHPVRRVYNPLTGAEIPFTCENGICSFTIPELWCHATTILEYNS